MRLSLIIPVLNEAETIHATLAHARQATNGDESGDADGIGDEAAEIIVVDGGSTDATVPAASGLADQVVHSAPGRALQMNAGAALATGDILLFLHADTLLPAQAGRIICAGLADGRHAWGRFDVDIDGRARMLPVIAFCMNLRSRLSGIATGDQAIFVLRTEFLAAGGYAAQPLMEDIDLSTRLKARSRPLCLRERVHTSGRRWDTRGVWRTILLMWTLRLRYWFGAPADRLHRSYR